MNSELNSKVAKALNGKEKIIWCGQPKIKLFSLLDLFLIPFTCIWTSMPLLGSIKGWTKFLMHKKGDDLFMLLWLSMFALFGLYITVGRFIHEYLRRRACYFIVTNERVVVLSKIWPEVIRSWSLGQLKNIVVVRADKKSKVGTIYFEQMSINEQLKPVASKATNDPTASDFKELIFYDLSDLEAAIAAIKQVCKPDQLQIEETDSIGVIALVKRFYKLASKDKQKPVSEGPSYQLIEGEQYTPNIISNLPKKEADQLILAHKRIYIGRSLGMLAGFVCAIVFGFNALNVYAERNQAVLSSQAWPNAQGTIEKLEIITGKGSPYLRNFKIFFAVNGKNYTCDKYSYDDFSDRLKDAQYKFALAHKKGDLVNVFYDPQDPERNVLTRTTTISHNQEDMGKLFIGIGLFILAIVVLRLITFRLKTFEAKPLKATSLGGEVFRSAFLSVWACMFFGGILSMSAGPIMRSLAHLRTIP